jgi:hypothetical protein
MPNSPFNPIAAKTRLRVNGTLCRMKPRVLNLIAAYAMAVPLGIWIAAEIAIRVIPGCKVQIYHDNLCGAIILAEFGGFAIILVLTCLVALPLFVIAAFLRLHKRVGNGF